MSRISHKDTFKISNLWTKPIVPFRVSSMWDVEFNNTVNLAKNSNLVDKLPFPNVELN